mgnify:FL=1
MLNFDEAAALYTSDPEAFERYRRNEIGALLHTILEQRGEEAERKAKALQWKLDVLRNRTKNPLVLNTKLSVMMIESMAEMGKQLTNLLEKTRGNTT